MTRIGRYWLFFVIVAVGLALSWGQVGRKTRQTLQDTPVVFLQTEPDCRPAQAPCAALGRDRALVVGPATTGLLARHTGFERDTIVSAAALSLDAAGDELARATLLPGALSWRMNNVPASARTLRLQVRSLRETTVAEFPLSAQ